MALSEHRSSSPAGASVRVAVISVSDTRTMETDQGGALVQTMTQAAGFSVVARHLVRDQPATIGALVRDLAGAGHVDAILMTGGTGMAPRDATIEAVTPLFTKHLDGFGELFRMLSFETIGAAAMMSRATAGVIGGVAIFLMPGSPAAVRLALERLILPELGHLVGELRKPAGEARTGDAPGESSLSQHGHPEGHAHDEGRAHREDHAHHHHGDGDSH